MALSNPTPPEPSTQPLSAEDEEDDYLTMTLPSPPRRTEKETYTQRRLRLQRESEAKARVPSKAERAVEEKAKLEEALSKRIDGAESGNKGLKMMAKLGFKPGQSLGKRKAEEEGKSGSARGEARTEPINVILKEDRGGIGMDSERKRKFREEVDTEAKRVKAGEEDYRERVREEREEKRAEGMFWGAMKVAEGLDGKDEQVGHEAVDVREPFRQTGRRLKDVPLEWRGLVRQREEAERERRMRYDLHQSLSRLPTYEDPDEDEDDKRALGKPGAEEVDLEEEDPELEGFLALPISERLEIVVGCMRKRHHYCFWCKYQYPDAEMEGCPGLTEEDHD